MPMPNPTLPSAHYRVEIVPPHTDKWGNENDWMVLWTPTDEEGVPTGPQDGTPQFEKLQDALSYAARSLYLDATTTS